MIDDLAYCPEPPEDFEPPDLDQLDYGFHREHERSLEAREPFTFRDEDHWKTCAVVYGDVGDLAAISQTEALRKQSDREFWQKRPLTAPLAAADLAALRDHDAQFDRDREDIDADDPPDDQALEAIGRALYEKNLDFWRRLRRFGCRGIPASLVVEANELLFPSGWERPTDQKSVLALPARRRRELCQVLGGRRREARPSSRRAAKRGATRAGPDGDGDPEPASAFPGPRRQEGTTGAARARTTPWRAAA